MRTLSLTLSLPLPREPNNTKGTPCNTSTPSASEERLKDIISGVAVEHGAVIEPIGVMDDHVHLLVSVDPQFGIHRLVKQFKGRSSRLLRDELPSVKSRLPSLWANSYYVGTTGGTQLDVIKRYIENQKSV